MIGERIAAGGTIILHNYVLFSKFALWPFPAQAAAAMSSNLHPIPTFCNQGYPMNTMPSFTISLPWSTSPCHTISSIL